MTERAELASLARRLREMGGLDVLVLNSGGPPQPMRELLDETEHERWQDSYVQQLQAPLNVILEVTPLLVERGWGRVVAITSASVKQPMTRHAVSTIFRSGVHGALKHLANELAAKGVTVNAVGPAGILTERLAKNYDLEERAKSIPMKRLGKLEELAATVVFLASEQAGFITGQTIQVDGGMTAARL
jgi:3-oxoacyl-[acyl-carrier protein] reductase